MRLGELALQAGLPDGLFQVLPGKGSVVGERFISHPDVRKIVFTGSTEIGVHVMAGAAKAIKRVTLELGGKSANIVFDDCDSVLKNETAINILKAALDTNQTRTVSWLTENAGERDGALPTASPSRAR